MTRMGTRVNERTVRPPGPGMIGRLSVAAAFLWAGLAAAQAVSTAAEPPTAANVFERRVPFQRWPRLGPKAVGLLVARRSAWGHAGRLAIVAPAEGPGGGGGDFFQLYVEGRSAGSFTLPAEDPGPNVSRRSRPVQLQDGGVVTWEKWLSPGMVPELKAAAQLVRVTVNGGKGFYGDGALYSDVEALDGTSEYPIVVARAMDEAKARWDRHLAAQRVALDRVLEEERRRVEAEIAEEARRELDAGTPTPPRPPGGEEDHTGHGERVRAEVAPSRAQARYGPDEKVVWAGFFPSWRDDPGELSVLFAFRHTRQRVRAWRELQSMRCPPGAPCLPPRMGTFSQTRAHGAAVALAVTFDRTGKAVREEPFPAVAFQPEIPGALPTRARETWHPPPTVQPPRVPAH